MYGFNDLSVHFSDIKYVTLLCNGPFGFFLLSEVESCCVAQAGSKRVGSSGPLVQPPK
jgi:hypothetical protein